MRTLSLTLTILAFGCNGNQNSKSDFETYYSNLPTLEYPIIIDCIYDFDYFDKSLIKDSLVLKYCPDHWQINGRIPLNDKFVALIYSYPGDFMYPSIFTFDFNGSPIDTLDLGTSCGEWHGNVERGIIKINKDNTINFIDSLTIYETDENEDIIKGTGYAKVTIKNYKIEKNGYFTMISEKKEKVDNVK